MIGPGAGESDPKEQVRLLAHDLRNLATVLTSVHETFERLLPARDELRSAAHYVAQALDRLQSIADQGRALARSEDDLLADDLRGMSHDLRNLATVLTAVVEMLTKLAPGAEDLAQPLRFVTIALERLQGVSERLNALRDSFGEE